MRASNSAEPLLRWLQATFVNSVRQHHDDLTMRQLAVMMITYSDEDAPTVRGLANSLRISRPAISRALDRLGEAGLTRRQVDPRDRRSVVIRRTRKGFQRIQHLRSLMAESALTVRDLSEKAACPATENSGPPGVPSHSDGGKVVSNGGTDLL